MEHTIIKNLTNKRTSLEKTASIFGIHLSIFALLILSSCNSFKNTTVEKNAQQHDKKIKLVTFEEVPLSNTIEEMKSMRVSPSVTLTYEDNSTETFPLEYKSLIKMGDEIGNGTFGMLVDVTGKPFKEKDGSNKINQHPDGNTFIKTGGKNYLLTHMESHPGVIYQTELEVVASELRATNTKPVDLTSTDGTIINCASTKTPWNTHLGGEEDYSLNGIFSDSESPFYMQCEHNDGWYNGAIVDGKQTYYCKYIQSMQKYLNDPDIDRDNGYNGKIFSPYNYGYTLEVKVNEDGSTQSARHYVTGKYTPELGIVMPDNKTVYMTDDGNAKGFWKFVSDTRIDDFNSNWQGSLFAAKAIQQSAENGGEFNISWIELGHASDNQIKKLVDSKMKITDIFEVKLPNKNKQCAAGFKLIYEDSMLECLRLKPNQKLAAAFLESRKYAAYLGATIEFRKEEGITYSPKTNKLYVSISNITQSMRDNYQDMETSNDIRLPKNSCGGVYELSLDDSFSVNHMKALITGRELEKGELHSEQNYCDPETIANPDNLSFFGSDLLIISEDSSRHLNNMSWAYNLVTNEYTRIASLPLGAEVTGVANALIEDEGFLFINQQHPFMDIPKNREKEKVYVELFEQATDEDLTASIGYIKGIPARIFVE